MSVETAKKLLEEYIKEDPIYEGYTKDGSACFSDFDKFCIEHIESIKVVLNYIKKLESNDKKYLTNQKD